MFAIDLIFAFIIALFLSLVFAAGFRRQGWGMGLFLFFLILFLATWAGGVWLVPVGPIVLGVPWMSFLLVGFVVALVLVTLVPPGRGGATDRFDADKRTKSEVDTVIAVDALFWILIVGLIVAILIAYWK